MPTNTPGRSPGQASASRVSLQVNLAPLDAPHAGYVLPHQLRALAAQVDEVVLTVDSSRNLSSRYRTEDYAEKQLKLQDILRDVCNQYPHARISHVDYSEEAIAEVAKFFTGTVSVPLRAADGSPIYAYLHGLHSATSEYVIHLDSDMFLGGGSQTWVSEAVSVLRNDPRVFAVNPLPGPPCADRRLRSQEGVAYPSVGADVRLGAAFRFEAVSTRVFLIDRSGFGSGAYVLPAVPPDMKRMIRAHLNNTPRVQPLENCLSVMMARTGLVRVDMLGSGKGMWSLHPNGRSAAFYRELPNLLRRVETGDIPEAQRGYHDVNDAFFDWSDERAANTRRRRIARNLLWTRAGLAERLSR